MTSIGPLTMEKGTIHSDNYADFSDQRFDSCNAQKLIAVKDKLLAQVVPYETPHSKFWVSAVQ